MVFGCCTFTEYPDGLFDFLGVLAGIFLIFPVFYSLNKTLLRKPTKTTTDALYTHLLFSNIKTSENLDDTEDLPPYLQQILDKLENNEPKGLLFTTFILIASSLAMLSVIVIYMQSLVLNPLELPFIWDIIYPSISVHSSCNCNYLWLYPLAYISVLIGAIASLIVILQFLYNLYWNAILKLPTISLLKKVGFITISFVILILLWAISVYFSFYFIDYSELFPLFIVFNIIFVYAALLMYALLSFIVSRLLLDYWTD